MNIDKTQYNQLLKEARRMAKKIPGTEICGLIIDTGHCLSFVQTRNYSRSAGSFRLGSDVRRVVVATKVLHQKVVGTFHSHPMAPANPGKSDIVNAVDDSLMFIFDCAGKEGRLWKIKNGWAREIKFALI